MSTITTILATDKIGDSRTVLNANFAALNADKLQINPALGTPTSGVATNLTGTAAGLTAGATTGVEAGADVTDATNVAAAGALMDSEVTNLAQVKAFASADYATASQGTLAAAALPKTGGAMTGAITTNSTFDGRDVANDGTKLDSINVSAITANTAKTTNATHTGEVTGSGALTVDKSSVTGKTLVTAVGTDHVLIADASDSGNLKKSLISDFASAGGDMAVSTYDPNSIAQQLAGLTATQTLTNKTINTASNTITVVASDVTDFDTEVGNNSAVAANTAKVTANTTNVTAAGALMDSEVTNLAQVKAFASSDYATTAQGAKADSAQQPPSEGAFANGDKTKLNGIEASADVTDTANVTSAGALMDSEVTNLAQVKAFASADYATAAQGTKADSALQNIVSDTTPQLGGNLDVNGKDIITVSNGNIEIDPNGSGVTIFKGNATKGSGQLKLNCEQNTHGIIIKGPPHSANADYTLTLPNDDGDANQVLETNGSGNLSWVTPAQVTVNTQTGTTYTTVAADASKFLTLNNGSAITLTIPPNSSVAYPVGTKIDLLQLGAGQVTVAGGSGVTVNATPTLKFRAQYSGASCIQYAANTWILAGDLASS